MGNETAAGPSAVARKVFVASAVYGLEIVKKAAYRFVDRASAVITIDGDNIVCTFSFSRGTNEASADGFVQDFHTELLDQDLRERIGKETAPARNAILALAFAAVKQQGE
jgi:His-Xaa-Ser system protein HxsD